MSKVKNWHIYERHNDICKAFVWHKRFPPRISANLANRIFLRRRALLRLIAYAGIARRLGKMLRKNPRAVFLMFSFFLFLIRSAAWHPIFGIRIKYISFSGNECWFHVSNACGIIDKYLSGSEGKLLAPSSSFSCLYTAIKEGKLMKHDYEYNNYYTDYSNHHKWS